MLGDPKECIEHAKNCLRLAADAPNEPVKLWFEKLARTWLGLARDLEISDELIEELQKKQKLN
jgi:hypothetical protein